MYSAAGYPGITLDGFPHSEISGSTLVCSSPKLIAACHVLHRLLAPRHPPYALSSLTTLGNWRNSRHRVRRSRRRSPDRAKGSLRFPEPRQPPTSTTSLRKATVCRVFSCQRPPPCAGPFRVRRSRLTPATQRPRKSGGEYRARTGDLLVANQALSQLS